MRRRHLFISLARYGWGEATMGLAIAKEIRESGDDIYFLVNTNLSSLLSSARVEAESVQESLGPLLRVLLEDIVAKEKPQSIVLADHLVCGDAFGRMGLNLDILSSFNLPVVAIDTWNHKETGTSIDLVGEAQWRIPEWSSAVTHSIVPVPFNRTDAAGACSFMPKCSPIPRRIRQHVRKDLGLSQQDRIAILCTSQWQARAVENPAGRHVADSVPRLVSKYFELLGRHFHLLHFAPEPIEGLRLSNSRYHWLPSFPPMLPEQFQSVVGSGDLVISLNYSATTNSLAIALGVPVLLVKNSCEATSIEDITNWLASPIGQSVREWANESLPLSRFRMWPLGFYNFLEPAFHNNDFLDVCVEVELLREEEFVSKCETMTSDSFCRAAFEDRRSRYISRLMALPRPGDAARKVIPQ